jgi:hypothetical protein
MEIVTDTEIPDTALTQILVLTYPSSLEKEPPREGKFLQIRLAGREYLVFAGDEEHRYHNQILARFLSDQGIPHHWEGQGNLVASHPALAIIGGGRFRLDPIEKTLRVWDASSVYGRFDAAALSAQLAAAEPPWRGLTLAVD